MNSYEYRQKILKSQRRARTLQERADRMWTQFHAAEAYEQAHLDAIGYRAKVDITNGWFHVKGYWNRSFRQAELEQHTQLLYAMQHEKEMYVPVAEQTA